MSQEVSLDDQFESLMGRTPKAPNPQVFQGTGGMFSVSDSARSTVRDGQNYNALNFESSPDFPQVANIWLKNTIPVSKFAETIRIQQTFKSDSVVPETSVRLNDNLQLTSGDVGFTKFGLSQLCRNYTEIPAGCVDYLSTHPEYYSVFKTIVNTELDKRTIEWAQDHSEKDKTVRDLMLRFRADDNGNKVVRSVVSERFGTIDNSQVMDMVMSNLPKESHDTIRASHAVNDGDRFFTNILFPEYMKTFPGDSDYLTGITVRNSEVGDGNFEINAFLCRAICMNGCIWGQMKNKGFEMKKKHLGNIDWNWLRGKVKAQIQMALDEGHGMIQSMQTAREIKVTNIPKTIVSVGTSGNLTQRQMQMTYKAWQEFTPESTAFGVVNAFTRAAQTFNSDQRIDVETLAGKILTPFVPDMKNFSEDSYKAEMNKHWGVIIRRADNVTQPEMEKVLVR